ncbi:hypothetical protein ACFQ0K_00480 [Nocardioides caeni]|uniref:Carboxypeptidase regulatory-like domain-containing protein n=1 Tax=Nocardioides caeni TaxID=574700 RepID=A0A4S8NNZ8_9ACTN|nr:hypothetical protein [Nocardioides caeni]THV18640.1 hypothetical protein E9934_03265 [Nocardioides caeni]
MRPPHARLRVALIPALLGLLLAIASVPLLASPARAADVVISGKVTGLNASGVTVPIKDVFIEASGADGAPLSPRRYAYTASDGTYQFTVPATGTYQIDVECWGDYACAESYAPDPTISRTITGSTVINATLERWGRITGTVKKGGVVTPWPTGGITATNDARSYWSSYPEVAVQPNGTFVIEKVAPGTVTVTGREPYGAEPFLTTVPDQTFAIPAGQTAAIDLAVENWSGFHLRAVTPSGTPLEGIRWNVFSRTPGGAWDAGLQYGPLATDANGSMTFQVRDKTRDYTLCFYDDARGATPAEQRVTRCLGGAPSLATATAWRWTSAQPKLKQDIALPLPFTTTPTPTISGTAAVGSTLTATPGTWAPVPTGLAYQWFRAGVAIEGAASSTYDATAADLGKALTLRVTATRSGYATTAKTSAASAPVAAGAFVTVPTPTITGTRRVGSLLTATAGTWAPAPSNLTYQWFRSGVAIPGATGSTYRLAAADARRQIGVRVTGSLSGLATQEAASAPVTVALGVFRAPAPRISGRLTVRSRLTAVVGTWSPTPTRTTYRWYRSGRLIRGASARTYVLTAADRGQRIKVVVTRSRAGYATLARGSLATRAIR